MPHRDDLEAAHLRIDALERELESARADADQSRARVETLERSAAQSATSSSTSKQTGKKSRKEKQRRELDRRGGDAPAAPVKGAWPQRIRYRNAVAILAAVVYAAAAIAFLVASDVEHPNPVTMIGPTAVIAVGIGVLGLVFRAPGPMGGALVTLLISGPVTAALGIGASDTLMAELLAPGLLRLLARVVVSVATVALGVVVVGAWVPDAASSEISGD